MRLPSDYETRMRLQLQEEYPDYLSAMEQLPRRGLRVNTLKIGVPEFLNILPWRLQPALIPEGFLLLDENARVGGNPLHRAGLFYMQEPSAMRAAALLHPSPGMRVLDLCAAPGGKAGQLAAYLAQEGLLVANEIVPGRAAVLAGTLERLGVRNALCTCMRPEPLCDALSGWFDAVLVDAPCSGEGMFRKEPQAIAAWSKEHVAACAARQALILDTASEALRPGGKLLYSTCTFSTEENEDTVRGFICRHPEFELLSEERYYPHTGIGEGHYMALLQKSGEEHAGPIFNARPVPLPRDIARAWAAFKEETMLIEPQGIPSLLPDGRLILLPDALPQGYEKLRIKSAGVHAAEYKNGRLMPAHGLCMAYPACAFVRTVPLADNALSSYFLGNTVEIDGNLSGFCAVLAQGFPVGWGKATDSVLKNHLPKGLRGPVAEFD